MPLKEYELLDSGELFKLERFGSKVLIRPSKFSIWKKRDPKAWNRADAIYDHVRGWKFLKGEKFEEWEMKEENLSMVLRLQQNGQVGLFPEHSLYEDEIASFLKESGGNVLNLFGYTGLATLLCARLGARVTHVDLSKQANQWAKMNVQLSGLEDKGVRFIQEDALSFLRKEKNRERRYDLLIADPPSFSRISSKETWNLDDIFVNLLSAIEAVLAPGGMVVLTSHRFELGEQVMENLVYDTFHTEVQVRSSTLSLKEVSSPRRLPAGFLSLVRARA